VTTPCNKEIYRFYDKTTGKAIADVITIVGETIDESKPYEIFDPIQTWKRKLLSNFTVRKLLEPVFAEGKCVHVQPSIEEMRHYCEQEVESLWESVKRFENPQTYYVDLSVNLWNVRNEILHQHATADSAAVLT